MEHDEELFTCIAFDPGGTTGWALISCYAEILQDRDYRVLDNLVFWACGQYIGPLSEQANEMLDLVRAWPRWSATVSEDFTLRQFRMDRTLLDPVRVNERFSQLLHNYDVDYLNAHARDERRLGPNAPPLDGPPYVRQVFLQQPALAMTTMTDARLKAAEDSLAALRGVAGPTAGGSGGVGGRGFGFFSATAGRPHARDALRHALTFIRREREARLGKHPHSLYLPRWSPPPAADAA